MDDHLGGRHREGDPAGRPLWLAGERQGEGPPRGRLLPLGPYIRLRGPWGKASSALGADDHRGPLVWLPTHGIYPPRLDSACAIGHVHHQSGRTGLCDLTGASIPCPPAVARFFCNGCACALRGDWLLRPLPDLQAHHPSMDALRRQSPREMAQRLLTRFALNGPHPNLRPGRAVIEQRGVLHQQPNLLGAEALRRGVGMARQNLLDTHVRVRQQTRGGHRLGPAMTGRRQTADRLRTQPLSELRQTLRMSDSMHVALRQLCCSPGAHSHAPCHGECKRIGAAGCALGSGPKMCIMLSA
jgi:hypothetical protein